MRSSATTTSSAIAIVLIERLMRNQIGFQLKRPMHPSEKPSNGECNTNSRIRLFFYHFSQRGFE